MTPGHARLREEESRMHRVDIPQWAIDRTLERRGKLHVHENLEPTKTALVVIDLQNAFMVEQVAAAYDRYHRQRKRSGGSRSAHRR
jgi:hypothetical protein